MSTRCKKPLELMNIKLTEVIAQMQGASGLRMIEAIVQGERDPQQLLALCDKRIIKTKSTQIRKALVGNYNSTWLFLLEQNLNMWKHHQQQLLIIDQRIEALLDELVRNRPDVTGTKPPKPIRHHQPSIKDLHQKLLNLHGVDVTTLSGITDYTLLQLAGETGIEMHRFQPPNTC